MYLLEFIKVVWRVIIDDHNDYDENGVGHSQDDSMSVDENTSSEQIAQLLDVVDDDDEEYEDVDFVLSEAEELRLDDAVENFYRHISEDERDDDELDEYVQRVVLLYYRRKISNPRQALREAYRMYKSKQL